MVLATATRFSMDWIVLPILKEYLKRNSDVIAHLSTLCSSELKSIVPVAFIRNDSVFNKCVLANPPDLVQAGSCSS